jgi:hypothetical protein
MINQICIHIVYHCVNKGEIVNWMGVQCTPEDNDAIGVQCTPEDLAAVCYHFN